MVNVQTPASPSLLSVVKEETPKEVNPTTFITGNLAEDSSDHDELIDVEQLQEDIKSQQNV